MRIRQGNPLKNEVPGEKRRWDEATLIIRDFVMLTSIRGLSAATIALSAALLSAPAFAQEEETSDVSVSGNVALVTDYRFRGVSLSDEEFAIQGGIDLALPAGFYVGTWASSIDEGLGYGSTELDVYGGWSSEITSGLTLDVGFLAYLYPGDDGCNCDYYEPYASLSGSVGPADLTVGVAYAFDQDSLDFGADGGTDDNLYIYTDVGVGIPETPVSLSGHLGYTDGVLTFTNDGKAFDWSVGASVSVMGLDIGVSYIGVEGPDVKGLDDAIVGTLSFSF